MVDKATTLGTRLGRQIHVKRTSRSWTQAQLAERVGVDTETVSRFERGVALPSLSRLQQIAKALKTTISELLSEQPAKADEDVIVVSAWLSELSPKDRDFALRSMKDLCNQLRKK